MLQAFSISDKFPVRFDEFYPTEYKSKIIDGSTAYFASGKWGEVFLQQVKHLHFEISHKICKLHEEGLQIFTRSESPVFHASAILMNGCRQTIAGLGRTYLQEHQFCSLYGKAWNVQLHASKGNVIECLDTFWDDHYLQTALNCLNLPSPFQRTTESTLPQAIGTPYREVSPHMQKIIKSIFYNPFTSPLKEVYLEELMHQYLLEVLAASANENLPMQISETEHKKILDAENLIASDLDAHLSTAEIARRVGLNEFRLKIGFKRVVGKSIFEHLQYLRLAAVRDEMLQSDLPLKAFAKKAGFADLASFVKGFNTHLGCYPSSLRNRSHPDNK